MACVFRRRLERHCAARNAEDATAAEHVQEIVAEEANGGAAVMPVVTNAVEAEDDAERPVNTVEAELAREEVIVQIVVGLWKPRMLL